MVFLEKRFPSLAGSSTRGVVGNFSGVVSPNKKAVEYPLTVKQRSRISASLKGLKADADLFLINSDKRTIAQSRKPGRKSELIQKTLDPGTYFVRVVRYSGRTRYRLVVSNETSLTSTPAAPTPVAPTPVAPTPATPTPAAPRTNPFQSLWGDYYGLGTTTIGVLDPFSKEVISVDSFQVNIRGKVRAPLAEEGFVESNPFYLSIDSPQAGSQGAFSLFSSLIWPYQGSLYGLQHWTLQYDGSQITGRLTLTDQGEALKANQFDSIQFDSTKDFGVGLAFDFSYPMDVGTTLQGTLTSNEIRLRIQGLDTSRTRAFISDIVVQRI
jgi:hypothetical protein